MKYNTDYFAQKKEPETPATPAVPTPTQHAVAQGPAGYSQDMLRNLGLLPEQMTSPGATGMAQVGSVPNWYENPVPPATPMPLLSDALMAIFGSVPLPTAPATPDPSTTPAPTTPTRKTRPKPTYNWGGND